MSIAYKTRVRRSVDGRATTVLSHPDTGEELGRFFSTGQGYRVLMPDGGGRCTVLLPDTYPTQLAAKQEILQAHEPETE